jgi:fused signal recognition particle receptor
MALFSRLVAKIRGAASGDWDELERALIEADLGRKNADELIAIARTTRAESAESALTTTLNSWLYRGERTNLLEHSGVVLIVGVNGTGKTTSVAKLGNYLVQNGKKILLAACDTFRAAAVDQLRTWGERINIPVVIGGQDPASVAFDATKRFIDDGCDLLLIDTAGRLHTKSDLMDELGKIKRVVEKSIPVTDVLLVLDATTGQNGLAQAKVFLDAVKVTGIILTKMDGSAKGGIALAVERELGIPILFTAFGEGIEDLAPFHPGEYISSLIS